MKNDNIRELVAYLFVGLAGTIVSWIAAYVGKLVFDPDIAIQNAMINTFSWIVGVCSAYPMNREWVFRSTNPNVIKEFCGFAASRVSTLLLDVFIMWFTVNIIGLEYWVAKIFISTVIVTIANYISSKVLIFKKK